MLFLKSTKNTVIYKVLIANLRSGLATIHVAHKIYTKTHVS